MKNRSPRARSFFRRWHRRISTLIGLQLLAWTASGLVFTLRPIEEIRGEHLLAESPEPTPVPVSTLFPISRLWEQNQLPPQAAALKWQRNRWTWELDPSESLFDAQSGESLPLMDQDEAVATARRLLKKPGKVIATEYISESPKKGDFRGGKVPAWRIEFDQPENVHLYLDARSGQKRSLRTRAWRRFDFFWGLHIMDWRQREDFHHPLLIAAAGFGLLSSISGLALAWLVYRKRLRELSLRSSDEAGKASPGFGP